MNKDLAQLVKLSKADIEISNFEPMIEAENGKLNSFIEMADNIKVTMEALSSQVEELESNKSEHELNILEAKDKLISNAKKVRDITNEKEQRSLQVEESIAQDGINSSNEEIARIEDVIIRKLVELDELKEKLKEDEKDIEEIRVIVDKKIVGFNDKRDGVSKKRSNLVEKMDSKVLIFYEKIRRWAKNTAVVCIRKQACYGCFIKINDSIYREILKSEHIITCPHCGRVLYKEDETS